MYTFWRNTWKAFQLKLFNVIETKRADFQLLVINRGFHLGFYMLLLYIRIVWMSDEVNHNPLFVWCPIFQICYTGFDALSFIPSRNCTSEYLSTEPNCSHKTKNHKLKWKNQFHSAFFLILQVTWICNWMFKIKRISSIHRNSPKTTNRITMWIIILSQPNWPKWTFKSWSIFSLLKLKLIGMIIGLLTEITKYLLIHSFMD